MSVGRLPEGFKLFGDKIRVNIALPEFSESGIWRSLKERDPRLWRIKPDAYKGVVEDVGPNCKYLEVGDIVSIERWEWLQMNVDGERILGREGEVLTRKRGADEFVMPGVSVMKIFSMNKTTPLVLPEGFWQPKEDYDCFYGEVIASNPDGVKMTADDYYPVVGDKLLLRKWENYQWKLGQDLLIFRPDHRYMLARVEKKEIEFEVVGASAPQLQKGAIQ